MGNYYEGKLTIALKKDIPHDLHLALINMCYWKDEMKIPEKWKNEPIFKNDKFDRLRISYGFTMSEEDDEVSLLEYEGEDLCEIFEEQEELWDRVCGYYVELNLCLKGYKNLCEEFIDWIKPYANIKYNYLGNIHDEDGYMNKDFFLDDTEFKKEIEKTKIVCGDCEKFCETAFCNNYFYCKKAFDKGVASVKKE